MPTFRLTAQRLRLIAVLLLMGSTSGYALGHQLNRALHDASPVPPAISHVQTASGRLGAPTPTPPAGAGPSYAAPPVVYRLVSHNVPAPATNAPRSSGATTGQVPASSLPPQPAAPTHGDANLKQDHAHDGQDQGHEHNADHDHDKPPDNTKASGQSGHSGQGSSSGPNAPDASDTPTAATAPVVPTATTVPSPAAQPQSNPRQRQRTPSGQSGDSSTRGQATSW